MTIKKYFIALVVPEPFQTELMNFKRFIADTYNSKGALRSPAHITLHMPFEWKEEKEDKLINTLQQFSYKEAFTIDLLNFFCFAPRVLFVDVVKNETLIQLQSELVSHAKKNLRLLNQANDMRGFHPHITIAFRDLRKEKFYEALEYFKTQSYQASFKANNFCLLKHTGKEWLVHKEFFFTS
jgi:2'-5' RNA ligase